MFIKLHSADPSFRKSVPSGAPLVKGVAGTHSHSEVSEGSLERSHMARLYAAPYGSPMECTYGGIYGADLWGAGIVDLCVIYI